jgi:hypothetical protein
MLISELNHPTNDIVNDIVNVVVTMRCEHFLGERSANALDLRSEELAG